MTTTITLTDDDARLVHAALRTLVRHLEQVAIDQQSLMTEQAGTLTADAAPWRIQEAGRLADQAAELRYRLEEQAAHTDPIPRWVSTLLRLPEQVIDR